MPTVSRLKPKGPTALLLLGYPIATLVFAVVSLTLLGRANSGAFRSLGIAISIYGVVLSLVTLGLSVAESRRDNASQVTIFGIFFSGALLIGFLVLLIELFSKATAGSQTDMVVLILLGTYVALSLYWLAIMSIRTIKAGLWKS